MNSVESTLLMQTGTTTKCWTFCQVSECPTKDCHRDMEIPPSESSSQGTRHKWIKIICLWWAQSDPSSLANTQKNMKCRKTWQEAQHKRSTLPNVRWNNRLLQEEHPLHQASHPIRWSVWWWWWSCWEYSNHSSWYFIQFTVKHLKHSSVLSAYWMYTEGVKDRISCW